MLRRLRLLFCLLTASMLWFVYCDVLPIWCRYRWWPRPVLVCSVVGINEFVRYIVVMIISFCRICYYFLLLGISGDVVHFCSHSVNDCIRIDMMTNSTPMPVSVGMMRPNVYVKLILWLRCHFYVRLFYGITCALSVIIVFETTFSLLTIAWYLIDIDAYCDVYCCLMISFSTLHCWRAKLYAIPIHTACQNTMLLCRKLPVNISLFLIPCPYQCCFCWYYILCATLPILVRIVKCPDYQNDYWCLLTYYHFFYSILIQVIWTIDALILMLLPVWYQCHSWPYLQCYFPLIPTCSCYDGDTILISLHSVKFYIDDYSMNDDTSSIGWQWYACLNVPETLRYHCAVYLPACSIAKWCCFLLMRELFIWYVKVYCLGVTTDAIPTCMTLTTMPSIFDHLYWYRTFAPPLLTPWWVLTLWHSWFAVCSYAEVICYRTASRPWRVLYCTESDVCSPTTDICNK